MKYLIAITLILCLLVSSASAGIRENWVCRHYVAYYGLIKYVNQENFYVVNGKQFYQGKWTRHIRIEMYDGRIVDYTVGVRYQKDFHETSRWDVNVRSEAETFLAFCKRNLTIDDVQEILGG